jgi:hypothetical protein
MMAAVRRWLVVGLFALIYLYSFPYFGDLRHANELPRVLTTQELVHHHTFELSGRSKEVGSWADISTTPKGRLYQNKAPGISILGAIVYAPLAFVYWVAGAGMPSLRVTTWLLRVSLITLPALLFLVLFRRIAERFAGDDKVGRDGALLGYALGSMLLPYALVFMSHAPGTVAVGTAFALASGLTRGEARSPRRSALAIGSLLGLAMFIEYQAIFAAAFILLFVGLRGPQRLRGLATSVAAVVPWLAVLAAYHALCFGSPFRTGYAYSVDVANRAGVLGVVGPTWTSVNQLLAYGSNGLFVLSPWILLSFLGAFTIARDADLRKRVGAEALVASGIVATYLLFVASLGPEFGRAGWSVGPRYLAIAMPFFGWLAAAGITYTAEQTILRVPAVATVLVAVIINVLAATTYPHWPIQFVNPIFEVSIRLLREGLAPHSIGTLLGLRGAASVWPIYLVVFGLVARLLFPAGVRRNHFVIATVLAIAAVYRLHDFATTAEPDRTTTWKLVVSTFEPVN